MSETESPIDPTSEPPAQKIPWGPILVVVFVLAMGFFAFWVMHEKKSDREHQAALAVLELELGGEEQAVKEQREKVTGLTKRIEELRTRIQIGDVPDGKAAIAEFNKLAAEQRAERDKFVQMADQYNQKVAKSRQLAE